MVAEDTSAATAPTVAAYGAALCEELRLVDASLNRLQEAHCTQLAGPDTREDRLSLLGLEIAWQVIGFLFCSGHWHCLCCGSLDQLWELVQDSTHKS